jgi:hypothetical protein
MRARRTATVPAVLAVTLALLGLGSAGCVTQVHGQGTVDPQAATISTSASPTLVPTRTPTPPPTTPPTTPPTVDPAAERRITCLLITPSVAKAIRDWNNLVDHKRGTRAGVANSLTASAATIDTVLRSSRIRPYDPIRAWAVRLAAEMRVMAAALKRGGAPSVTRFNELKRRLQGACPKG